MPLRTRAALHAQLASGELDALYALVGADDQEKASLAQEFISSVDEGLRAFNVERFRGSEAEVSDLIDAAATFPMMAPRRLVIVWGAEGLLMPKREGSATAEAAQDSLEAFFDDPPSHATVVFVCGDLDRRRRVVKRLLERAAVIDCGTLNEPADAERWVQARATQAGIPVDGSAVKALVERAGTDIGRLRAGLERVGLYALGAPTISAADVRAVVAAGPDTPEHFGIADAIGARDAMRALRELHAALAMGAAPFLVLGQIRTAAERQPGDRLAAAMDAVLRTDLGLKSSGDARVLLERLVVELCGPGGRATAAVSPRTRPTFRR